jgi:hypothetical protein
MQGEALELLLATHVLNSGVTEKVAAPAAVCCAKCFDWPLAAKVVTCRRVERMAYSRPFCKRDGGLLSFVWSGFFMPAWLQAVFQKYVVRSR